MTEDDADQPRPFTVAKLAAHWEVSEWMIYDMLSTGKLQGFKIGGKLWRISAEEVRRIETGSEAPSDSPSMETSAESASNGSTASEKKPRAVPSPEERERIRENRRIIRAIRKQ